MRYVYIAAGLILGIVFLGIAKNTKRRKFIPREVIKKLKSSNRMDEYNIWCDKEAKADMIVGIGFVLFGLSMTFADTNAALSNIGVIISLVVFLVGYIMRIVNNKKHLDHFFVR